MNNIEYVISTHNAGFFSCCSLRLDNIIRFFNKYKLLPTPNIIIHDECHSITGYNTY